MNRRRKYRTRPSQAERAFARSINHRRLRLERYEPRLALSSISFFQVSLSESLASASTAQGGYADVRSGGLIGLSANDFVDVEYGNSVKLPSYHVKDNNTVDGSGESPAPSETFDPWQGPVDSSSPSSDKPQNSVSSDRDTTSPANVGFEGNADLNADTTTGGSQTIPDPRIDLGKDAFKSEYPSKIRTGVFTKSAEIADELSDPFVSVSSKSKLSAKSNAAHLEGLFTDLRETMAATVANAAEIPEGTNLTDAAPFDSEQNLSTPNGQPGISERLMLSSIDGRELDLSADQQAVQSDTQEIAEGGAIDVAATVNHARTEHEARAFEAVATLLNDQGIVDELTTPAQQPLVGELARAVALEMASFEGTALPIHSEGAVNRRGSAGAEVGAGIPLSYHDAETAPAETSTFSVAPWPLMFRAALGTAIVAWRRKSKSPADPNSGYFEPKDE